MRRVKRSIRLSKNLSKRSRLVLCTIFYRIISDLIVQDDYKAAEAKLKEERAGLVATDNELADLEKDLKKKKQEIVDAELNLKKFEHDLGLAAKDKTAAEHTKEALEKQFPWIVDEHQ